jgi:hypothetical protein
MYAEMVASGTLIKLNQKLWPGCHYARSDAGEVARFDDRYFVRCRDRRMSASFPSLFRFCGADAPSARGSQPRSSDLTGLSRSRAGRPAQAKGLPHET